MDIILLGLNILIIGGDSREVELCLHLKKIGANVHLYGFEKYPHLENISVSDNLIASIRLSQVIITPLMGIDANGEIYTPYAKEKVLLNERKVLRAFNPRSLLIAGHVWPAFKEILIQSNILVCETREMDEISVPGAVPTAEGAIQVAMENTKSTIHGSKVLVLGYGRCGSILAHTLKALGAEVTVAVRRKKILPWIEAYKMRPLELNFMAEEIGKFDLVFNTIPALILDAEVLYRVKKNTLIIDIATSPGGVDFAAAERLSIPAISLPGLPGRVAPKTAAGILCKVYPDIIISALKRGEKS